MRTRFAFIAAACSAVAIFAASASAEVVKPQVVKPEVVTPQVLTPAPSAPAAASPTPAVSPAPQVAQAAPSRQLPSAQSAPSPRVSSDTNASDQAAGNSAPNDSSPSGGYSREQADSVADYGLALYDISLFWSKQPYDAIRTPLSAEAVWTLSIQVLNDIRHAVENGKELEPPTWQYVDGDKLDQDPPPEHSLNPPPPQPEPAQDSSPATPVDSSPAPIDAGGPAGGRPLDDETVKSEQ